MHTAHKTEVERLVVCILYQCEIVEACTSLSSLVLPLCLLLHYRVFVLHNESTTIVFYSSVDI